MGILTKYKREIIAFLVLSILYFAIRTIFILGLPIFTDEAIYVRWAQIALNDANWRYISLTDGKQPLFIWFMLVFMKFIQDPLLSGRLVSVFSGFFTMWGLWFLSYEIFKSKKTAFITSILYLFYPFAQVLDRMALYDSMVGAFYVWATYFSILLVRKIRLDIAYTLGFLIGGGVLTKTTNFFSIYLLPFTLIIFDWKKNGLIMRLLKLVSLFILAYAISQVFYSILRLSPFFGTIAVKNANFVYPFSEWIKDPFLHVASNAKGLTDWLLEYLKVSYVILIVASFFFQIKYTKEKILLFLYFIIPFAGLIVFGKTIFPRFVFFMSLPLLCLAGFGLFQLTIYLRNKLFRQAKGNVRMLFSFVMIFIFVAYPGFVTLQFAYDPVSARITKADSKQYVNNWTAGWGVKESISFLKNESENKKIFVATEGTFGLLPASLELYLVQNKNLTIKGYWPVDPQNLPEEVLEYSKIMPTYFIFYQQKNTAIPAGSPLRLVFKVREGKSNFYYRLYKVK